MSQPPESLEPSADQPRSQPGDDSTTSGPRRPDGARAEAARRARLAAVFGDVLPETTGDERDAGSSGGRGESWYRENRPPHHGG